MSADRKNFHAILWMLLSTFTAAIMVALIRYATDFMHPFQVVFFRNFFSVLIFLPLLATGMRVKFKTSQFKLYFYRGSGGTIAMLLWFYGLSVIPLPMAVSLSFTVPIIIAILSIILLNEKYGWHRWAALITGFIGTLIILRPGTEAFDMQSFFVIGATFFWAMSSILIKKLVAFDHPIVVTFYSTLLMAIFSLPFMLPFWQPMELSTIGLAIAIAAIANIFQIALAKSFDGVDFAVVMPFDYMRLIFTAIIAYIWFDETIDGWTAIGSAVIVASTAYAAWRTKKQGKKSKIQPMQAGIRL